MKNLLKSTLKSIIIHNMKNKYYIKIGRKIDAISRLYDVDYRDAFIIYGEWANGLLKDSEPLEEELRRYAKFTSNKNLFEEWIKTLYK